MLLVRASETTWVNPEQVVAVVEDDNDTAVFFINDPKPVIVHGVPIGEVIESMASHAREMAEGWVTIGGSDA